MIKLHRMRVLGIFDTSSLQDSTARGQMLLAFVDRRLVSHARLESDSADTLLARFRASARLPD